MLKLAKLTKYKLVSLLASAGLIGLLLFGHAQAATLHAYDKSVCKSRVATMRCHARVITDRSGNPAINSGPTGLSPAQFIKAYNLPTNPTAPATIAIVDAYDDPNIKADLDKYNSQFKLPVFPNCSSTITTACFMKVDQRGGSAFPATNSGWALETSLDVEVAHGLCPSCKLILVEADSNSYDNLMGAVDRARLLGAKVISNSYGGSEARWETDFDNHFNYPGIAFTFSSGDSGYGVSYPAASPYVTAVGGTTLVLDSSSNWRNETVWNGAGSGCSAYELKPSFQSDPGCTRRTVADVAADANPSSGAAVYDSVRYQGKSGWFKIGGTSLAAPIIAAVYALAGDPPNNVMANSMPYSLKNYSLNMHDITTGSNGFCGTGLTRAYLCKAAIGYDGPSGLGTPRGTTAF